MKVRFIILILLTSCAHYGKKLDTQLILTSSPYNQVHYVVKAPENLRKVARVTAVTRGDSAQIKQTLPELYSLVLHYKNRSATVLNHENHLFISDLDFGQWSNLEKVKVSYQECKNVRDSNGNYTSKCETKYRWEQQYVHYLRASADVYR